MRTRYNLNVCTFRFSIGHTIPAKSRQVSHDIDNFTNCMWVYILSDSSMEHLQWIHGLFYGEVGKACWLRSSWWDVIQNFRGANGGFLVALHDKLKTE